MPLKLSHGGFIVITVCLVIKMDKSCVLLPGAVGDHTLLPVDHRAQRRHIRTGLR